MLTRPLTTPLTALATLVLGALLAGPLQATTTYIGTVGNSSAWTITYEGPSGDVSGTAFDSNGMGNNISLTSTAHNDGNFVGATGSLTNAQLNMAFNGVWEADLDFTVPADAINVVLTFSGLAADDRVVLELNGTEIGNSGLQGTTNANGVMSFVLDSPGTTVTQDFDADTAGSISTGFVLGGSNDLRLVVNNTNSAPDFVHGTNLAAASQGFQTSGDATLVGLNADISYDEVPEPSTLLVMFGALTAIGIARRRAHEALRG